MSSMTAPLRAARQKVWRPMPNTNFQSRGSMNCAPARRCLRPRATADDLRALTAMSFVIVPQVDEDVSSVARHAPAPATQLRRTRHTAVRHAVRAIWPRPFHQAQSAKARRRAAFPQRRGCARARLPKATPATLQPRPQPIPRRANLEPGRLRREKERQKRRLRQARMQRIGALETFVTLSWTALDGFLRQRPVRRIRSWRESGWGPDARLSHSGPLLTAHCLKEMGQNGDVCAMADDGVAGPLRPVS